MPALITRADVQQAIQETDAELLERIARTLRTFYQANTSASTLQPILNLCVELNPDLPERLV